ncbi:Toprim domain-containing protein [Candidatus Hydrogenisulfobacillus filiaventi]|uniref:Toprim domain-containing protein n=1 Tax=Candidatus Hydrogenisulfobacillus filiaventi TaxID=2707344 RepID=A0A6F8ZGN4_9FIRM|nr:topoisomerase [Bacillota bacterium]CAB1129047.1 Toprim domain-containing protein [Candidatus Hydrogenisulfobacillus filiaventi]
MAGMEVAEEFLLVVEGKNDRRQLRRLLGDAVPIVTTNGIPSWEKLMCIARMARHRQVVIFTDADASGRRIRGILREQFPDAINLYTKPSYRGVEHTPLPYLSERLGRIGLPVKAEAVRDGPALR